MHFLMLAAIALRPSSPLSSSTAQKLSIVLFWSLDTNRVLSTAFNKMLDLSTNGAEDDVTFPFVSCEMRFSAYRKAASRSGDWMPMSNFTKCLRNTSAGLEEGKGGFSVITSVKEDVSAELH